MDLHPNRSQSAVEINQIPFNTSYGTGNNSRLHINPNKTKTSRPATTLPITESQFIIDPNESTPFLTKKGPQDCIPLIDDGPEDATRVSFDKPQPPALEKGTTCRLSVSAVLRADSKVWFQRAKIGILLIITVLCCGVIMLAGEEQEKAKLLIIQSSEPVTLLTQKTLHDKPYLKLYVSGPFYKEHHVNYSETAVTFQLDSHRVNLTVNTTAAQLGDAVEREIDFTCGSSRSLCKLTAYSEIQIPIKWYVKNLTGELDHAVVYSFLVLGFVYVLIIFELVHRTLAALLGSLAAMAVLSAINLRPTMVKIMSWMDSETLTLLFGMMVIVAIFQETGFFDYSALKAYKMAKGKVWPLVTLLCVFSAVVSAFLDNVTTILLMAPVTIRLCEVLNLEPRRILIAEVLFANIGGTATAIGDPPNVIIVAALSNRGITFTTFTLHMFPGIVIISLVGYGFLRFYYRNLDALRNTDPPNIAEMKHQIAMWKQTASRLSNVSREETVMRALFLQKSVEIEHQMNQIIYRERRDEEINLQDTLRQLERQYCIKDVGLLVKCGFVLTVVISFLFMYSFIGKIHLSIGWIAVMGALILLVLADIQDIESVLHRVEWSTLLFFAALFVLMEALAELGMITTIGDGIADLVMSVGQAHRLLLAMVVILWVSAIASSFIDNIPYTTAMVPVLVQLTENPKLDLPLLPLVMALAFGACLGGNGTLIGASCNVVCAGIAEQHGHGFSFMDFFKVGFPMMLVTTFVSCCYILVCHSAIGWNDV